MLKTGKSAIFFAAIMKKTRRAARTSRISSAARSACKQTLFFHTILVDQTLINILLNCFSDYNTKEWGLRLKAKKEGTEINQSCSEKDRQDKTADTRNAQENRMLESGEVREAG